MLSITRGILPQRPVDANVPYWLMFAMVNFLTHIYLDNIQLNTVYNEHTFSTSSTQFSLYNLVNTGNNEKLDKQSVKYYHLLVYGVKLLPINFI